MNHRVQAHVHISLLVLSLLALGACSSQQKAGSANKRILATVSGLLGSGLVIQTNGGNSVTVKANGSVELAYISSGAHYDVTISEQPHDPVQSCVVTGGSGVVGDSDVSNVSVACTGGAYDVIAQVSGLVGTGLVLREDHTGNSSPVTADGKVTLASQLKDGTSYSIEVTNPTGPSQTCTAFPAAGTLAGANAMIAVTCSPVFEVTASVTGLHGQGLRLYEQTSNRYVTVTADGTATLAHQVADGFSYTVKVDAQPTSLSQTCTPILTSGTVAGANVNVAVTCVTNSFTIRNTIFGYTGSGLALSTTGLGLGDISVTSWATSFGTPVSLPSGSSYAVTVATQPLGLFCFVVKGKGTVTDSSITIVVACKPKILSAGSYHTAVIKYGALWTWGADSYGSTQLAPKQVGTDANWSVVSAGLYYTLGIRTDGSLWGWGANDYGQLADATFSSNRSLGPVGSDKDWAFISAGLMHVAALKTDGSLWTWGSGAAGQLGNGNTSIPKNPTPTSLGYGWAFVSVGANYDLGIKTDGSLWAWGQNNFGQLGDGTTTYRSVPVPIGTSTDWALVSAGGTFSAALKADGSRCAWGRNQESELGDGTVTAVELSPKCVSATGLTSISAGDTHTIALKTDGTLLSWGDNGYGELGDGTRTNRSTPWSMATPTGCSLISTGFYHSVAMTPGYSLWAWGSNTEGEVGKGTTTSAESSPYQIWQ